MAQKNAAAAEKDDRPRLRMMFAPGRPQSVIHIKRRTHCKKAGPTRGCVAIPHVLRDARGGNESSLRCLIPCIHPGYQLRQALGLQQRGP